jgi:hypothetical protein
VVRSDRRLSADRPLPFILTRPSAMNTHEEKPQADVLCNGTHLSTKLFPKRHTATDWVGRRKELQRNKRSARHSRGNENRVRIDLRSVGLDYHGHEQRRRAKRRPRPQSGVGKKTITAMPLHTALLQPLRILASVATCRRHTGLAFRQVDTTNSVTVDSIPVACNKINTGV